MGLSHGMNDAQKTMGIIALALAGATSHGIFAELPDWLGFLRLEGGAGGSPDIPIWIKVLCALTMAAGTAAGSVIFVASHFGIPVSTTHTISSAIMGVGSAKHHNAIKWSVVERMIWAWVLTIPVTGGLSYMLVEAFRWAGLVH